MKETAPVPVPSNDVVRSSDETPKPPKPSKSSGDAPAAEELVRLALYPH